MDIKLSWKMTKVNGPSRPIVGSILVNFSTIITYLHLLYLLIDILFYCINAFCFNKSIVIILILLVRLIVIYSYINITKVLNYSINNKINKEGIIIGIIVLNQLKDVRVKVIVWFYRIISIKS